MSSYHYPSPIHPALVTVSTTQSVSGSVLQGTESSAATLQSSVRPHLEPRPVPSPDQHGIETAPGTQRLIPADPHNQRSVTSQSSPPLQSSPHSQSSAQMTTDLPHPECGDAVAHQSRIVEDVISRHTSGLTRTIGNDLPYFSNKFIELRFISRDASDDITTQRGVGNREKSSQLLSLVIDHFQRSCNKKNLFDKFVGVFSSEAAYEDLATRMIEDFKNSISHTPSSPSTSHTPQLSPHVRSFIDYVKTTYRESEVERQTSVVKWPPTPSKVYINLVCIDRHSVSGRSRKYDEVTEAMVRDGNVDAIVDVTKGPINFSEIAKNIFISNGREKATSKSSKKKGDNRRLILVEGAPGVGKSTFAWEFCRRWERGEIAQQYQLVLLLRLREERISNAKSLEDLIYHPLKDVHQAVCHELVLAHNFHALIILEGFDELPDRCRKDGSIFMDLIAGKLLPLATVLVTSRPWATQGIRRNSNRIYQHIEILGFTGRQITEYIESTLPQDKVSDLKAYLESHPQIRAGMYIPLNSAIVVTVYDESQASGYAMPTTLTELYTSLARTLLLRYLCGHPEYGADDQFLSTFNDLPLPVYKNFCKLCKLAYNGTVGTRRQVQLIFRGLPSDFDDLGFMDSVTELYVTRGAVSSHNFLHLTFQEFFAAVHISNMSPEEQVEHFKRHEEGRLKVVLRFLAGLNKLNCFSIEEIASNFFQTPSTRKGIRYLISCDAAVGIGLVQWLFEAQSDDVIERVLGQKTIEFELSSGMLPLDYYSLGYCISHSQCQWVLGLGKKIGEDEVRMLAAGAGTSSEPRGRVIELKRKQTERSKSQMNKSLLSLSGKCLNLLFTEWKSILHLHQLSLELPMSCDCITWPDLSALRVLELMTTGEYYHKWKFQTLFPNLPLDSESVTTDCERKLETLLPHLSLESLTVLSSGDSDCVAIGNHVMSTTSLEELSFHARFRNRGYPMEDVSAALASNQSLPLERLELECYTFTATAGDSLAQFITNTTTLKYLSIKECTFSAHALLVLAKAIHHNSILQTKNVEEFMLTVNGDSEVKDLVQLLVKYPDLMNRIGPYKSIKCNEISDAEAVSLAQAIERNFIPLKWLDLSNNSISDAGAEALAQALHHNSTLTQLNLSNNSISDAGAEALAQALHDNSTLTQLELSNNSISDAGAEALAQALHDNSTLAQLELSNNSISDAGAEALAQALHDNSTLAQLELSNNSISDAGAEALAQALHDNSTLAQLELSNNSISDAGAEALAQALHYNSTLTQLELSNNSISDAGAVALAQALHHNSTLTRLYMSGSNGIGEEGTRQLVQALTVTTSISNYDGLSLPTRCREYATKCQQYSTVENRMDFR